MNIDQAVSEIIRKQVLVQSTDKNLGLTQIRVVFTKTSHVDTQVELFADVRGGGILFFKARTDPDKLANDFAYRQALIEYAVAEFDYLYR